MNEMDGLTSRINEFANLLGQLGDIDDQKAAGLLDADEYAEKKVRQLAYLKALDALADGDEVDDVAFAAMLADAEEIVAQPTQEEINAANIDYLLMLEGEL